MDKINWYGGRDEDEHRGRLFPHFRIYRLGGQLTLFIMDDRPQSIPIKSVRQGKIRAKKYLDAKLYEMYGA